jgi:hypothetical protein
MINDHKYDQEPTTRQWQIPIGLQLVPGAILGFGMLFLVESFRWYASNRYKVLARLSLLWIRGDQNIEAEWEEVLEGVKAEREIAKRRTWKVMLRPTHRFRVFVVITIQLCQQLTGNTSLAYFAPTIFGLAGGQDKVMLLTGFFGVIKVVSVLIFIVCLFPPSFVPSMLKYSRLLLLIA